MSNTKTIARNAGWYGIDNIVSSVVILFTSIAINRYLGPSKNGYIIYVSYIASVVSNLGGLGITATTRKYMAEFIGKGDWGTARFVYFRTFLLQTIFSTLATGGLLVWVLRDAQGEYKTASLLLVLSMWPSMLNAVPAQANVAEEQMFANLPASICSAITYFFAISATVFFHWGVIGVGAALLSMRTIDFIVRAVPSLRRVSAWERAHTNPPELRERMMSFAWQSVASMIIALIVWDRSEVILLKNFCPDIRQVAFYSIAFTLAEKLLMGSLVFGSASSTTVFAQYGRDKTRIPAIAATTVRYLFLTAIPLHFIFSALAVPVLLLLFGHQFEGAAMVVTLAPLLCLPKAFLGPAQSILQSAERQGYVIGATIVAGLVDISVAWYLVRTHGAVGACIGSGAAQILAVGTIWGVSIHLYKVKLPWVLLAKVVFISLLAAAAAHFVAAQFVAVRFAPLWGLMLGGSASLVVLLPLLYLLRVLEPEDRNRFYTLIQILPEQFAKPLQKILSVMIRPQSTNAITDNRLDNL